jgi:bifunctional non-homologous end joining protein LigD
MGLAVYKHKRNFKATPEPPDHVAKTKGALSFVVQRHDASHLHYDFRLEMEGVLKSWAVPKGPSMKAGERRLAVMVEDHPLAYGKFYGEIPEGNYGAGTVDLWDRGTYEPMEKTNKGNAEKLLLTQLKNGDLKFTLKGEHLKGSFALVRINDESGKNWLLIKKKDEYAEATYDISKIKPVRAFSGKHNGVKKEIAVPAKKRTAKKYSGSTENIETVWPKLQKPMLAKLTDAVHNDPQWMYEAKYDGYRAVTMVHDQKAEMVSRNGNSFTKRYHNLVTELEQIDDDIILDGEVVIEDQHGVSNFQLLQNFMTTHEGVLKYYVFDILFLNGYSLTGLPLSQRKELLESFFAKYSFKHVLQSTVIIGKGEQLLKKLTAKGYEGIIAKESSGLYHTGKRAADWLKIKSVMMQEVVICGYTLPQRSRKHFGSLVLGLYQNDELVYIGNCGTGFTEVSLEQLFKQFSKLKTERCPFKEKPTLTATKGKPVWMKPVLVCNVKFLQWTKDGRLRNPVFMGLRDDKDAMDVVREEPKDQQEVKTNKVKKEKPDATKEETKKATGAETTLTIGSKKVKVTNLSKVYWPDDNITKGDLIAYYQSIDRWILPYLKDRPQSLNRFPNGIKGPGFYQKDMDVEQLPSWAKTARIYSKSNNKYLDYLICNDAATLVYMANLGCIEINPWHSVHTNPDYPDYMMMDLDPGKISFTAVVDTALVIKEICDELKINCFCKTSGATGLHVYIPLGAKYHYDDVKLFAELMATITHKRLPKITSIERSVAKRKNKVYVDFLQNRKGQTIAAPYSVRPKPHATVSTPLLWKEVSHDLSPQQFTIKTIHKRLNKLGDLWKGVFSKGVSIDKLLPKMEKMLGS